MKLKIEKLDYYGRGISHIDGKIIFVSNTLPNEEVEIEITEEHKNYSIGTLTKIIKESKRRIKSDCPYYDKCGGCHLRHISIEEQQNFKINKIFEILKIKPELIHLNENFYRNKIELKIINSQMGYFEEKTHSIIPINKCLNANEKINEILNQIYLLKIINGNIVLRSNYLNEILLIISTENKININEFLTKCSVKGIILNNKVIFGDDYFKEKIRDNFYKISYNSFFQINEKITTELLDFISANIKSNEIVADLYCGVGTFGIAISKKAQKVIAIDISKSNIQDAKLNQELNKMKNIEFILGNVNKCFSKLNTKIDTIIIDPPRQGLDKKTIQLINNIKPSKIIYVSCNPLTLKRDLFLFNEYQIKTLKAFDMFPNTYHVESVSVLNRR